MSKLKKGEHPENWRENCKKFAEYYKKRNPEWSGDRCVEEAKKYNRSINWQCVEYYQRLYPKKTVQECEEMRLRAIVKKRENHPFNIEYYRKRYPEASEEELLKMLSDAKRKYAKNRPDNSGVNNPAHHSKTTALERRQRSPKCIEFYQVKSQF